jgi:hypothetical protein
MRRPHRSRVPVLLAALALATACGQKLGDVQPSVPASPQPTGTAAATATGSTPVKSPVEKFGVPECDTFIATYQGCLRTAPEEQRPALQYNLDQMLARLRQLAADGRTRPTLPATCLTIQQMMKEDLMLRGCST